MMVEQYLTFLQMFNTGGLSVGLERKLLHVQKEFLSDMFHPFTSCLSVLR